MTYSKFKFFKNSDYFYLYATREDRMRLGIASANKFADNKNRLGKL